MTSDDNSKKPPRWDFTLRIDGAPRTSVPEFLRALPTAKVIDPQEEVANAKTPEARARLEKKYFEYLALDTVGIAVGIDECVDLRALGDIAQRYSGDSPGMDLAIGCFFETKEAFLSLPVYLVDCLTKLRATLTFNITYADGLSSDYENEWNYALLVQNLPRAAASELLARFPSDDVLDPKEELGKPGIPRRKAFLEKVVDFDRLRVAVAIDAAYDGAFIGDFLSRHPDDGISVCVAFRVLLGDASAYWFAPSQVVECIRSLQSPLSIYIQTPFS